MVRKCADCGEELPYIAYGSGKNQYCAFCWVNQKNRKKNVMVGSKTMKYMKGHGFKI